MPQAEDLVPEVAMHARLIPIFESRARFLRLDHDSLKKENPAVLKYLSEFSADLEAIENYKLIRQFLRLCQSSSNTYYGYRIHLERLFLWSLNIANKSLIKLTPTDLRSFSEFYRFPPFDWIGPAPTNHFIRIGGRQAQEADLYLPNARWRPFCQSPASNLNPSRSPIPEHQYKAGATTIDVMMIVVRSFFDFIAEQELSRSVNPAYRGRKTIKTNAISNRAIYRQPLSSEDWEDLLTTALIMAEGNPSVHERTLFVVATLHYACRTISDITGNPYWLPMMKDFVQDESGKWKRHTIDTKHRIKIIHIQDEYMDNYMARYRIWLGLPRLLSWQDEWPLLSTHDGRPGLSEGHIRRIVKAVISSAWQRRMDNNAKPMNDRKFLALSMACLCIPNG